MSVVRLDKIEWENTHYGRRRSINIGEYGIPLIVRYVIVKDKVKPHSHPKGEVIYVLEGEGVVEFENGELKIEAGSILIIPPKVRQSIRNTGREELKMLAIIPE
ncbi:MAG: cupin domain-containing protein [archaeon GB-1867-097]|nr:cupin domain-containing protein [Candidatus Culexmicrobium thermophilum]MCS7384622.1 cupin domain-containing protein [Candidatus Culexmicrobium thermophilum]RLE54129.1 MAG: hypothetical protein DRJ30_05730 [Candidatus Verstraetearchaeota archaeon]HDO20069.1 cupin domain-containing protein [Candidatus Bathyarchaeota archaeon]